MTQGCFEMGYKAAKLLHRRLEGKKVPESQVLVGPVGVEARQSTEFKALSDISLFLLKHFIFIFLISQNFFIIAHATYSGLEE